MVGTSVSYAKVARAGFFWSFARPGLTQLFEIPAMLLLARLLGPEEFGVAAAVSFFLRLANKVGGLGLGGALIRLKELRPEHLSSVFFVNLMVGVCSWGALTLGASRLAEFFGNDAIGPALQVAALVYLALPFGTVQVAILAREFRFREASIVEWVYPVTFSFVSITLAWRGAGFWSLIYGQLSANVLQSLTRVYLVRWYPNLNLSARALRDVFPIGSGLQAKNLLNFAGEYLDSLIVGRLFGLTALGFYDRAFNIMERLSDRLTFALLSFRIFSLMSDEPERLRRAYEKVLRTLSLVAFPMFGTLIVVAPQFITILYGQKWLPLVPAFQILCATAPLRILTAQANSAAQATGRVWPQVWRQLTYVVLIVTGVLALRSWGITGAALGVSVATAWMALLMQIFACRTLAFGWRRVVTAQAPGLVLALVLAGALLATAWVMRIEIHQPPAWQLFAAQIVVGLLVVAAFLRFVPHSDIDDILDTVLGDMAPSFARFVGRRGLVAYVRSDRHDERRIPKMSPLDTQL